MAKKGFNKQQLEKINGHLDALIRVSEKDVPRLIEKTLTNMQKDVKALAPVSRGGPSMGNLKRSVYKEFNKYDGKLYVDTTLTDPRRSGFNYGRVVEHGRAGQYKTTNYFYEPIKKRLGLLLVDILSAIKESFK